MLYHDFFHFLGHKFGTDLLFSASQPQFETTPLDLKLKTMIWWTEKNMTSSPKSNPKWVVCGWAQGLDSYHLLTAAPWMFMAPNFNGSSSHRKWSFNHQEWVIQLAKMVIQLYYIQLTSKNGDLPNKHVFFLSCKDGDVSINMVVKWFLEHQKSW